jgi:hypothetical protein
MIFPNSDALLADLSRDTPPKLRELNKVVAQLVDGYGMVSFSPLDITDEDRCDLLKPCWQLMLNSGRLLVHSNALHSQHGTVNVRLPRFRFGGVQPAENLWSSCRKEACLSSILF